ncbi:TIGR03086 family protein [Actinomadura logoneensis]|uniref:TIGR03086 family protein n=1 Tax=Actinomadura logoneensis TaxID=2293572 RepID=A0A372JI89_9ACTN|nr:TIGR03086 family metal-binding protein [Actinomadura logoneensis]RFU39742.1 TIGR03086 family protein [Actinomadura logoneensis]
MAVEFDFEPAAHRLAGVLAGIPGDGLEAPTPCADLSVAALLDHVNGLTRAFGEVARKTRETGSRPPRPDAANLPADWRERIDRQLKDLVEAWREPSAWEGMGEAGGVTLPAPVLARVALDELVLHGWDLARATGQSYDVPAEEAEICLALFASLPGQEDGPRPPDAAFGPPVPVPDDAPALDRLVARSGRNPSWTP